MAEETQAGRVIGGRYRLIEPLKSGSGGFGRVWKAHDENLDVDVAVKEVSLPEAASEGQRTDMLARANREARKAAKLRDHPNIAAVHDVVIEDGIPWTVMRLVIGTSLQGHLDNGPLPVDQVVHVAKGLLNALGAAHAAGIVHRDVKPANVMLASTGEVLLIDFGIAVHQDDTRTINGMIIGSPGYMAPERVRGERGEPPSDLFSLGATLYHAVEGDSPFRRDTPEESATAILHYQPPQPPCEDGLAQLIMRLLDKDPGKRPTIPQALAMVDTYGPATSGIPVFLPTDKSKIATMAEMRSVADLTRWSSLTEATVTRWLKSVGDTVAEDEPLLEISADKYKFAMPSPISGVLLAINVAEGEAFDLRAQLAVIGVDKVNTIADPRLEVGEQFLGTVVKTVAFGAFVSLSPGKAGLLHISKLGCGRRISRVEDVVKVGDKLYVEIAHIDKRGKISLTVAVEDDPARN